MSSIWQASQMPRTASHTRPDIERVRRKTGGSVAAISCFRGAQQSVGENEAGGVQIGVKVQVGKRLGLRFSRGTRTGKRGGERRPYQFWQKGLWSRECQEGTLLGERDWKRKSACVQKIGRIRSCWAIKDCIEGNLTV